MRHSVRHAVWLLGLLCLWNAVSAVAFAELDVERVTWGIDGKLRKGRFNLVTVEVRNTSDEPFDGQLTLQPTHGLGQGVDIPLVQPDVFIEPYGSRAVQFVIYVPDSTPASYTVRWGRGPKEVYQPDDEPPMIDRQAVIQLLASGQTEAASVTSVDDSYFPTSAAGFDGVEAILLNHVPRWDELRARALKDWIHQGGTLHLFQESPGKYPEFGTSLAELNEPSTSFALGGGRVVRHDMNLSAANRKYLLENISKSVDREKTADGAAALDVNDPNALNNMNYAYQDFDVAATLNNMLRQMTQPQHSWPLIYLLAVLYLLAIFPGCWLLGRKRGDFRITYGVLIGVIALFSLGFRTVGARGYDEETVINTVAVARPVANGRAKVTQWGNFFVTGGGQFTVKHNAEGLVYGSGQASEGVRGISLNRPYGELRVDIPSFSGRSLVSTGVFKLDAPKLEVVKFGYPRNMIELELRIADPQKWFDKRYYGGAVIVGGNLHDLHPMGDRLRLTPVSRSVATELQGSSLSVYQRNPWMNEQPPQGEALFVQGKNVLIRQDLGVDRQDDLTTWSLPLDRVRVLLYCDLPDELKATVSANVKEKGRVLWVIDVPVTPLVPPEPTPADAPAASTTDGGLNVESPAGDDVSPDEPVPAAPAPDTPSPDTTSEAPATEASPPEAPTTDTPTPAEPQ